MIAFACATALLAAALALLIAFLAIAIVSAAFLPLLALVVLIERLLGRGGGGDAMREGYPKQGLYGLYPKGLHPWKGLYPKGLYPKGALAELEDDHEVDDDEEEDAALLVG